MKEVIVIIGASLFGGPLLALIEIKQGKKWAWMCWLGLMILIECWIYK